MRYLLFMLIGRAQLFLLMFRLFLCFEKMELLKCQWYVVGYRARGLDSAFLRQGERLCYSC